MQAMETLLRSPVPVPESGRRSLAVVLALMATDSMAMQVVSKVAHWGVSGANFKGVHEQLDELHGLFAGAADACAERATEMGAVVVLNVAKIGETMRIKDYPETPLGWAEHVREVCDRVDKYLELLADTLKIATGLADDGTIQRLGTLTDEIQHVTWKLLKHLEPGTAPVNVLTVP